jgi:hypothetical protein
MTNIHVLKTSLVTQLSQKAKILPNIYRRVIKIGKFESKYLYVIRPKFSCLRFLETIFGRSLKIKFSYLSLFLGVFKEILGLFKFIFYTFIKIHNYD